MTKKILCCALALLTASTILTGCDSFTKVTNETAADTATITVADSQAETEAGTTDAEQAAETTQQETAQEATAAIDENDPDVQAAKEMVETFVSYIKSGDNAKASEMLWAGQEYDFFDDFTLDSYTIKLSDDQYFEYQKSFDVVFNISGSSCDLFPDGQSTWRITSGDGVTIIDEFFPLDKVQEMHDKFEITKYEGKYDGTLLNSAYDYAYGFSFSTDCFEISSEDLKNFKCDSEAIHKIFHTLDFSEKQNVPVSDIVAQIKQVYNVTVSEEDFSNRFNDLIENGVMAVGGCGHGSGWYFYNLKSSAETDSTITVNIEYYGDSGYLVPVKESSYVFNKNSDGTITLDSVSQVYDTGVALGSGAI